MLEFECGWRTCAAPVGRNGAVESARVKARSPLRTIGRMGERMVATGDMESSGSCTDMRWVNRAQQVCIFRDFIRRAPSCNMANEGVSVNFFPAQILHRFGFAANNCSVGGFRHRRRPALNADRVELNESLRSRIPQTDIWLLVTCKKTVLRLRMYTLCQVVRRRTTVAVYISEGWVTELRYLSGQLAFWPCAAVAQPKSYLSITAAVNESAS